MEIFTMLVQFLYRGSCKVCQLEACWDDWSEDNEFAKTIAKEEDLKLAEIWALGDILCYPRLQDWVLETFETLFHERYEYEWSLELFKRVWDLTEDNAIIRPFILDKTAKYIKPDMIKAKRESLEINNFLFDLLLYKLDEEDNSSVASDEIAGSNRSGHESSYSAHSVE